MSSGFKQIMRTREFIDALNQTPWKSGNHHHHLYSVHKKNLS